MQLFMYQMHSNNKLNDDISNMEHSRFCKGCSSRQEILWDIRKSKVHYHVHKSLSLILTLMSQVLTLLSYLFEIHFIIILPSMPESPKWSFSFKLPSQNAIWTSHLFHAYYTYWISHSPSFDNPTIWRWLEITNLLIVQVSPLPCYSTHLYPKILFRAPFFKLLQYIFSSL